MATSVAFRPLQGRLSRPVGAWRLVPSLACFKPHFHSIAGYTGGYSVGC